MTKRRFANAVSFVGNPLILSVIVAIYTNFKLYPFKQALTLTGILVVFAVVPVFFYINRKVKQGNYADHDVSARTKRPSLYMIGLLALAIMIFALYLTKQPPNIVYGAWAAWLLTLVSFLINFKLKTSLHVGFSFLIAFLVLSSDLLVGGILTAFAFLVGWSRLTLKRHTLSEIFMGASLGTIIGSIYWYFV